MSSRLVDARWGTMLALGALLSGADDARASGFQLAEQSARGLGNAFAGGAAVAEDPSTIFFNPAGLTRLEGTQVSSSIMFVATSGEWKDAGSRDAFGTPLSGGDGQNGGGFAAIPTMFASYAIDDRWTAGIGVTVPFGLATVWEDTWKGRYLALESKLETMNIQPSIAYQIDDHWSVGGGVDYQRIAIRLTQAVDYGTLAVAGLGPDAADDLGLSPQNNDGRAIIDGDDWSWGFNFGVLWEMDEKTRFGAHYRSKLDHRITGDGKFTIPERAKPLRAGGAFFDTDFVAKITLPEVIHLSGVHELNDDWTLMGDIQWTRWSRIDAIDVDYTNPAQPTGTLNTDWDDALKLTVGAEYAYSDVLTLRCGVAYDQDPTKRATRTPRVPSDDHLWLSTGFTYQVRDDLALDFGYTYIFVQDGHIDQVGDFGERTVGKVEQNFHVFALGATLKF